MLVVGVHTTGTLRAISSRKSEPRISWRRRVSSRSQETPFANISHTGPHRILFPRSIEGKRLVGGCCARHHAWRVDTEENDRHFGIPSGSAGLGRKNEQRNRYVIIRVYVVYPASRWFGSYKYKHWLDRQLGLPIQRNLKSIQKGSTTDCIGITEDVKATRR